MCLLVAQTIASELLLGGRVQEDYFNRLTFSLKEVLFVSPFTTVFLSVIFPSLAAAVVVFFCQSSVPYQKKMRRLFVGGAVQTGFVCLRVFSGALSLDFAALIDGLFHPLCCLYQ